MLEFSAEVTHRTAEQILAQLRARPVSQPTRRRNKRRRTRRLGMGGEVRIGGPVSATTHRTRGTRFGTVAITYARLRTVAQVARANRLNAELYGPEYIEVGPGS